MIDLAKSWADTAFHSAIASRRRLPPGVYIDFIAKLDKLDQQALYSYVAERVAAAFQSYAKTCELREAEADEDRTTPVVRVDYAASDPTVEDAYIEIEAV